jgi:hypothetical protein
MQEVCRAAKFLAVSRSSVSVILLAVLVGEESMAEIRCGTLLRPAGRSATDTQASTATDTQASTATWLSVDPELATTWILRLRGGEKVATPGFCEAEGCIRAACFGLEAPVACARHSKARRPTLTLSLAPPSRHGPQLTDGCCSRKAFATCATQSVAIQAASPLQTTARWSRPAGRCARCFASCTRCISPRWLQTMIFAPRPSLCLSLSLSLSPSLPLSPSSSLPLSLSPPLPLRRLLRGAGQRTDGHTLQDPSHVDVRHRSVLCQKGSKGDGDGGCCRRQALFADPERPRQRYCARHRGAGMVDVQSTRCQHPVRPARLLRPASAPCRPLPLPRRASGAEPRARRAARLSGRRAARSPRRAGVSHSTSHQ